jgi:hypothetical protein
VGFSLLRIECWMVEYGIVRRLLNIEWSKK